MRLDCLYGCQTPFVCGKAAGVEADHLISSSAKVNYKWMCTSIVRYACMTWTETTLYFNLVYVAVSGRYVEKINALPFLFAKRSTGSKTGFLEISRRNKEISQNRYQNFRFALILGATCPSVRQNTIQNTCNMWSNILVSDSIGWNLNTVRLFDSSLCFRLQMNMKQTGSASETSFSFKTYEDWESPREWNSFTKS
jgi:hypothetical protein